MRRTGRLIGFFRTTAIGGLLFLLPLIVLGALLGQIAPIVMSIAELLSEYLPVHTPSGIAVLVLAAIAIVVLFCFIAGLLARKSFGRRISTAFEKKLSIFFPRYAILKDQMADTIGGDHMRAAMKPVVVRLDESLRIGFETERSKDGQLVAVYLPGSPDPWSGKVALFDAGRVESLEAEFGVAVSTCEQLGKGAIALLAESGIPFKTP